MSQTTTIRVDTATHKQLLAMSQAAGTSLVETVRAATEALRRQSFGAVVQAELHELRGDPEAWAAYIADADSAVADGLN